jgi:sugar diacid utilization regulator
MNADVDVSEIEYHEGSNLVMKASNGVSMYLKTDSALKMIKKGIAVPII